MKPIPLRVLRLHPQRDGDLPLPSLQTAGSAGLDLRASLTEDLVLAPGDWAAVPTGLVMAVPPGCEIQIRARSGLAVRHGVTVLNGVGTVDADYRGEVKVLLVNHGRQAFVVRRGDRVAQAVIATLAPITVTEVASIDDTERGSGGFGSTGTR